MDASETPAPPLVPPPAPLPPPARRRLSRRTWWELFLQFGAVLFGVVGATFVTDWREDRAARALQARALQSIANEIAYNRAHLADRRSYYASVAAQAAELVTRAAAGEPVAVADLTTFRGFNPFLLRQSSFEISRNAQALGAFDFDLAERIAHTYALQTWLLKGFDQWMDFIVARDPNELTLPQLRQIMHDWTQMCDEVLLAHDELTGLLPAPSAR